MASKTGMFLEEEDRKRLIRTLESTGDLRRTESGDIHVHHGGEGCRICGNDDDHTSLMLCEGCNDEYHIYCLDPPLRSVPDEDWFCRKSLSLCCMLASSYPL